MSFRTKVKKNTPKVDFQSYNVLIAGGYKTGKTRAWVELMNLMYPNDPDSALLIAWEKGYSTWEVDSLLDMTDGDWKYFKDVVVKELVQEAAVVPRQTKVLGFDTVDKMIEKCTKYVLDELLFRKYGKHYTDLQEFQQATKSSEGYTMLKNELNNMYETLKNAGYGFIWLAWTKDKEVATRDGLKYTQLDLKMSNTAKDSVFHSQADLVCVLFNDTKVMNRDGEVLEENEKTTKGKETAAQFHTTETNMYFRESNFIGIAGGRFKNLPEKVLYSAENFMNVFEEAVKGQLKNTTKTVEEIAHDEIRDREEKAKEFAETFAPTSTPTAEELQNKIQKELDTNWDNKKKGQHLLPYFPKTLGMASYRDCFDVEKLQEALKFVTEHQDKKDKK